MTEADEAKAGHHYQVHGLHMVSDFPCPELRETAPAERPDMVVTEGETPLRLENPAQTRARFEVAPGQLLLQVDGVARYWVRDGRRIIVQRAPGADWDSVRLFLYGTAFGGLLLQRGTLVLHATTVVKRDQALTICGASGVGKSTLAHTLISRGWRLLADDVTRVQPVADGFWAHPGLPSIKLWQDVLKAAGEEPGLHPRIRPELNKYRWNSNEAFQVEPVPMRALLVLRRHAGAQVEVAPVNGARKFPVLVRQTYRRQMIEGMVAQEELFAAWSRLLGSVPFWNVQRPDHPFRPDLLADAVEPLLP